MGIGKFSIAAIVAAGLLGASSAFAQTNALVLNEANCVTGTSYLKNGAADTGMIGVRVQGNGNNWIELVVTGDDGAGTVDLRGYQINWHYAKDATHFGSGSILFRSVSAFSAVPTGTIITISEFQKISYSTSATGPSSGYPRWAGIDGYGAEKSYVSGKHITDGNLINLSTTSTTWHKHFWAGDGGVTKFGSGSSSYGQSTYFEFRGSITAGTGSGATTYIGESQDAGLFVANNDNWGMQIVHGATLVQDWVGEAETDWYDADAGVGNDEVLKLEQVDINDPDAATYDFAANYSNALIRDGKESTMGAENVWSSGAGQQTFQSIR